MVSQKLFKQCCSFATLMTLGCNASLAAMPKTDDVISAINDQKILAAGSRMSVKIDKEHVTISTYRQTKETDKTNKVQAIFIAKAVMDLSADVTRVSVYFFDSTSLSKYRQVNVTSGDIKAYEGDQLTRDQLLSSIEIKDGQLADDAARISTYVDSRSAGYRVDAALINNEVVLKTKLESWASDRDARFLALKLASEALDADTDNVKAVRVDFSDPTDSTSIREIVFTPKSVKSLIDQLDGVLGPVSVVAKKADSGSVTASDGILKDERTALLERIKTLGASGVGVSSYITAFKALELLVPAGDADKVNAQIQSLSAALDTQEKAAKDAKAKAAESKQTKAVSAAPQVNVNASVSRWVLKTEPILDARVLQNPDAYIQEIEYKVSTTEKPDDSQRFAGALMYFAIVLRKHNRGDEAVKFEQRLALIRAKHPKF